MVSRLVLLTSLPLCIFLNSCGDREAAVAAKETARLAEAFPALESFGVRSYRYETWCQALEYRRGRFASNSDDNCSGILDGSRRPFDQTARRDLEQIRQIMRGASERLRIASELVFNTDGKLIRGSFDCSENLKDRVYFFQPGYSLPESTPPGKSYRPVDANWYVLLPAI